MTPRPALRARSRDAAGSTSIPDGKRITDRDEIDRLNAIALPPAYTHAWFCSDPNRPHPSTGFDAQGPQAVPLPPRFRTRQEAEKFDGCAEFGGSAPECASGSRRTSRGAALSRERVVASVVRLLDLGAIRVGNESYAKENKSFGATTLRHAPRQRVGRDAQAALQGQVRADCRGRR